MSNMSSFKAAGQQSFVDGSLSTKSKANQLTENLQPGQTKDKDFADYLKESINEVNAAQQTADKMSTNLAIGKSENIHETMLAISQAELGFKLMVQVRNKALEAYQEIMRMPV